MTKTTITLDYPYQTAGGKQITEVALRRATVGDMRRVVAQHKNPADYEIALFSRLLGMIPEDLDPMDEADYRRVQAAYAAQVGRNKSPAKSDGEYGVAGEVVPDAAL